MTDTPPEPEDVVIRPPAATVYGKASLASTVVMNVSGVVERLTAEDATPKEIVDGIRTEAPTIAEVVERHAPQTRAEFHAWLDHVLNLIAIAAALYAIYRQGAAQLSEEDIARIIDAVLSQVEEPGAGSAPERG